MVKGIDISKYQGVLDFERAKAEKELSFVILRLMVGGSGKDTMVDTNYRKAVEAGLPVGFYVYGNANTVDEAEAEARAAISYLKGKEPTLPVFYDVESKSMVALNERELTDVVKAFCDIIELEGYTPGIYASTTVFDNYLYDNELLKYHHWLADWRKWTDKPTLKSGAEVKIWQTGSDKEYQDGKEVDTDICYYDYFQKPVNSDICAELNTIIKALTNIVKILES